MSKGEERIVQILIQNRIQFKREVIFDDLHGKKGVPLRYDFALYKQGRLVCLLEFDGEPHFIYSSHFNKSQKQFAYRKECDRRKNNYALAHKIPLYRIPFWEFDNLTSLRSLFRSDFLVKSMYHNDVLWRNKNGQI